MYKRRYTGKRVGRHGETCMRFLVDLYRWLILMVLAVALIAGTWLGVELAVGSLATAPQRTIYIAALIGAGIMIVLSLGITATFISIHDRLADIADSFTNRNAR
jgi:hypothetical protein